MLVAINEHALEIRLWEEKAALLKFLDNNQTPSLFFGEDAEQQHEFFSATIHVNYAGTINDKAAQSYTGSFDIAIISEGHGLKPQLVGLTNDVLVLGLNQQVIGVSITERREVFSYTFTSLFHAFVYSPEEEILLVRTEIGILALSNSGTELWKFEKDVVTDCQISFSDARIELSFMDADSVVLDLHTGRQYQKP